MCKSRIKSSQRKFSYTLNRFQVKMASSGTSKVNRELVAQEAGNELDTQSRGRKSSINLLKKVQDNVEDVESDETNSDEEMEEDEEYEHEIPGADWDKIIPSEYVRTKVQLRWSGFD